MIQCIACGGIGTYLYENDPPDTCPDCDGSGTVADDFYEESVNQPRGMTLLQRAMIDRLRAAGCPELAGLARDAWRSGEIAPLTYSAVDGSADERVPDELRADFALCNEQANRHPE